MRKILTSFLVLFFTAVALKANPIYPISREEGSGTRGAFVEIFQIFQQVGNKKLDSITPRAEITNSTAVMITTIANNKNAIGYISMGSLNPTIKTIKIDGIEPSIENIQNKTYPASRPFNVVVLKSNALIEDFLSFALSKDASHIIKKAGYIPSAENDYTLKNLAEKSSLLVQVQSLHLWKNSKKRI